MEITLRILLIEAAVPLDFELNICVPKNYGLPSKKVLDWAEKQGGKINLFHDVKKGVAGADRIMSDKWVSMGDQGDIKKRKRAI